MNRPAHKHRRSHAICQRRPGGDDAPNGLERREDSDQVRWGRTEPKDHTLGDRPEHRRAVGESFGFPPFTARSAFALAS